MTWICLALLSVACWCDLRTREIPDGISIGLAMCGTLAVLVGCLAWTNALLGFVVGLGAMLPLFYVGGLGGGDVKLVATLGICLGPWAMLSVLFWMAIVGALLSIFAKLRCQSDLAYAPAIAGGLVIHVFWPSLLVRLST